MEHIKVIRIMARVAITSKNKSHSSSFNSSVSAIAL